MSKNLPRDVLEHGATFERDHPIPEFLVPIKSWKPRDQDYLEERSEERLKEDMRRETGEDIIASLDEAEELLQHQSEGRAGRSGARVTNMWPSYVLEGEGEERAILRRQRQMFVRKDNGNKENNLLEAMLYKDMRMAGVPVPRCFMTEEGELLVEHMGDFPANELFSRCAEREVQNGTFRDPDSLFSVLKRDMPKLLSRSAYVATKVVENEGLEDNLERKSATRVAKSLGIDTDLVVQRPHMYRLLRAIPGSHSGAQSLLAPIERILDEAVEKYGIFNANVNPRNLFFAAKQGEQVLAAYDFNDIKKMSLQEAICYIVDAYMPIEMHRYLPARINACDQRKPGRRFSSAFLGQDKEEMIKEAIAGYSVLFKKEVEWKDFCKYFYAARFLANLQEANRAVTELTQAETYQDIFRAQEMIEHHYDMAIGALARIQMDHTSKSLLGAYIEHKYVSAITQVPTEASKQAFEWIVNSSIGEHQ